MPKPIRLTFEGAAWRVVRQETNRPETRAAIDRGRVIPGGEGPLARREVPVTVEDFQDIESILVALNRTLGFGKDATPAAAACHRALKILQAMKAPR
jgi:hypothetical protein